MSRIIIFSLLLFVNNIFAATAPIVVPTITKSISAGTTFKFTETLSGKLPTGYKVKIDLNNGKGLVPMTCSATICTLISNAFPKDVDSSTYKVGIYDGKGILQGTLIDGTYVISSLVETSSSPYTKISNSGAVLPDKAILGNSANDWACTKDNKTGLVWEVKTTDGGLRDVNNIYTNLNNNLEASNTYGFVKLINASSLCGSNKWRLPSKLELESLVYCSNEHFQTYGYKQEFCKVAANYPRINTVYFPDALIT